MSRKGPADFVSKADKNAEKIVFDELQQGAADLCLPDGGRRRGRGHRRPASLDRRSARRHHQFPPRHPAVRRRHRARARRRDRRLGDLQPGDGRALHRRKGRRRLARRPQAAARRRPQAPRRRVIVTGIKVARHRRRRCCSCASSAQITPAAAGIRRTGSASTDLAWLAAGRFDGYLGRRGSRPGTSPPAG